MELSNGTRLASLFLSFLISVLACGQAVAITDSATPTPIPSLPQPSVGDLLTSAPILIGTEYIIVEIPRRVAPLADMLSPLGLTAAKPLPENFAWGQMQKAADSTIDFTRLDEFVSQFQARGINGFVLALRSLSDWASKDIRVPGFFLPLKGGIKAEYLDEYETWVASIVERYDADGVDDMPGLRNPVRYYEIGVEFSSYEPEPVSEYLDILEIAYNAAHEAYPDVLVAHVAFLTTPALNEIVEPSKYTAVFATLQDKTHSLADMRAILDHPELFDLLNIHSLGHPYEIEAIVDWLNYETGQRAYTKPIIISDTGSTPFIAWGPATVCDRPSGQMGRLVPPATEADRCSLAAYFTKLVAADGDTLQWTQEFIAQDTVKRIVVAAEQEIVLINTAFTEDLLLLKLGLAQAGAGTAAWAGLVDFDRKEYRPVYYALQQLIDKLGAYDSITRIHFDDPGLRLYELNQSGRASWIAWYDPFELVLPDDTIPQIQLVYDFGATQVSIEVMAKSSDPPQMHIVNATNGQLTLTLNPSPVYISISN